MKIESKKLIQTIEKLKKDNIKNCKSTKKEGIMMSWSPDQVKSVIDVYLDSVVRLLGLSDKEVEKDDR